MISWELYAVVVISLVLIIANSEESFGFSKTYETLGFKFSYIPTICVFEPDPIISKNIRDFWLTHTKNAVMDWKFALENKEVRQSEKWKINYVEIPTGTNQDNSKCDIELYFSDKPPEGENWAGVYYPSIPPKGIIKIFYLDKQICNVTSDRYYIYYHYCYKDTFQTAKQIANIVRHEFGHALGLGHYVSDDENVNKEWAYGVRGTPSIMTEVLHYNDEVHKIRDIDINKLREIYGDNGFVDMPKIPTIAFESLYVSKNKFGVSKYDSDVAEIVGKITKEAYQKGQPVILTITKPDRTTEEIKTPVTNSRDFRTIFGLSALSLKGLYTINANYMDHEGKKISFSVVEKTITQKTTQTEDDSKYLKCKKYKNEISKYDACKKSIDKKSQKLKAGK